MIKRFNKLKNTAGIQTLILCSIAATIPFQINLGNIGIIIALLLSCFLFKKENLKKIKQFEFLALLLFFLIALVSALISKDQSKGISSLDRYFMLVVLAFIFVGIPITAKLREKVLNIFTISTTLSTSILLIYNGIKYLNGENIADITFHGFTSLYDQHPVYYSLYIALAITYLLNKMIERSGKLKVIEYAALIILSLGLLLCASKAVIFGVLIITFLLAIGLLRKGYPRRAGIVLFVLAGMVLLSPPEVKDRFKSGLTVSKNISEFTPTNNLRNKKYFTIEEKENISDLELRILFFKLASYHWLEDNAVLFGYGQGDAQHYLDYYYHSYNLAPNWYEGFNVHNQYLHILINYGILAFLLFIVYLIYSHRTAIVGMDGIYIAFITLLCFVFLFEVALIRNKGIIFFYFFNTLFLLSNRLNFENSNPRDQGNT